MSLDSRGESRDQPVLHFLGLDGETSKPFFPPWNLQQIRRAAENTPLGERDVRYGIDPEDPAEAGWGVIFASETEQDVRAELAPLLTRRKEQAGDRFRTYELFPGETLDRFRRRIQAGIGPASPERLPYYLLLVGDPEQIPFDFQYDLDVQHAVGRLAFPDAASYGIYAHGVCEHETRTTPPTEGLHLFSFDKENDPPMETALETLLRPLASVLDADFTSRESFDFQFLSGADASYDRLAESVLRGPPIIFTVGHAFLVRNGVKGQDEWQGGLVTGSHRGGSIEGASVYRAASVPDDADLCGRILYLYGCHTAGTPDFDSFDPNDEPERLAPRSFVAPLAQRLLAPPKGCGALAVIGQVDRAHPYSSLFWNEVPQIDTFVDTLRALCDGVPVGRAMETFGQRYANAAVETLRRPLRGGPPPDPVAVWTAYHDARAVALLGDPLVSVASPKKLET